MLEITIGTLYKFTGWAAVYTNKRMAIHDALPQKIQKSLGQSRTFLLLEKEYLINDEGMGYWKTKILSEGLICWMRIFNHEEEHLKSMEE